MPLPGNQPGDPFGEDSHALAEVKVAQKGDPLQPIGVRAGPNPEVIIMHTFKPFPQFPSEGQIPIRVVCPQRDILDTVKPICVVRGVGKT